MLQTSFVVGHYGSKIIVTTRSDKVASIMRSDHTHHLEQLSFEDCRMLFAKHAFKNGESSLHPKLEEIGKEIAEKCKGLPLAAKSLFDYDFSYQNLDKEGFPYFPYIK